MLPFLKSKEIRGMRFERRAEKLEELQTELSKLRGTIKSGGAIENPARIRELRHAIARIITIQNEEIRG